VHISFLEFYQKFMVKYGHADQKSQLAPIEKPHLSYFA